MITSLCCLLLSLTSPAEIASSVRMALQEAARNVSYAGYYGSPLDLDLYLSANFAEMRSNHFHSGIDIKTGGVEGKVVRAVADGYISRIGVVPGGFGRVLYIAHPNGTTSVYGHLQRFTPEIEKYVNNERYRQRRHQIDLYLGPKPFPVKKGQEIARSGNSGMSFGPHVHFEIRDTPSQRTLNPLTREVFAIRDDIPPMIVALHYVETDTVRGIPVHSAPKRIGVRRTAVGKYVLQDTAALQIGPEGYFVLETTDRKNGTNNTMGVYRVTETMDGQVVMDFRMDGFLFTQTRYVNSLTQYELQRGSRNELIRLALQANNRLPLYGEVRHRGLILPSPEGVHNVQIRVEDDNRNVSLLTFRVRQRQHAAQPDGLRFRADTTGRRLDYRKPFSYQAEGCSVSIPAGALYESIFYRQQVEELPASEQTRYAPVYAVHDADVPLHAAMTLSIAVPDVPQALTSKLCLAAVSSDGKRCSWAGGRYEAGRVTGSLRSFGRYSVVADQTPPTITPSFRQGADLRGVASVSFTIRDNFSGIAAFEATIDGKWILFEQDILKNRITHVFDPARFSFTGGKHTLVLTVTDGVGNRTTLTREFVK